MGLWLNNPAASYGIVFLAEAALFVWAASLIFNIDHQIKDTSAPNLGELEGVHLKTQLGGINP
jgi:hypothetical protein